ncbi:MAG TPA: sigma-E processing peptidase SpoIIGA [Candidatus Avamphibacillus intestinigallinarum]|nr:sigma-E processing peptidase SpoIIGA [Candidatus Avamphibacillus intestinigallinarum]
MTIYLDVIWLLNFFLDLLLLWLTQLLLKESISRFRLCFGALIASIIVPIEIYFPQSIFASAIGKFIFSIIIILCTFQYYSIQRFVKQLSMFYVNTFMIGGGLTALHHLFGPTFQMYGNKLVTSMNGYGDPISWLFLCIGFPILWLFSKQRMEAFADEKIVYDEFYAIEIDFNEKTYTTMGFIDSGNQLTDPFTKQPIVICDDVIIEQIFTKWERQQCQIAQETLDFSKIPEDWQTKIQPIPFLGVGGHTSFILTFKVDELRIFYDNEWSSVQKVKVGLQFGRLSEDFSYHCLLQPQLIKSRLSNVG